MIFHFAHAVKVTDNASVRKFKMAFYALRVTQIDVSAAEKLWDGECAAAGVWTG